MGNIVLYLHKSLDGVVSDPQRWMRFGDDMLEDALAYYDTLDTVVVGGHTYRSMADYWQAAEKTSASLLERAFARKINRINKIVLTRSPMELVWNHSQQLLFSDRETLIRDMEELKRESGGKHISVESGIRTWRLFLEAGLFDEMRLFVHPVIAGQGEKLFSGSEPEVSMRLLNRFDFEGGVVLQHYCRA